MCFWQRENGRLKDQLVKQTRQFKTENANLVSQLRQSEHRVKVYLVACVRHRVEVYHVLQRSNVGIVSVERSFHWRVYFCLRDECIHRVSGYYGVRSSIRVAAVCARVPCTRTVSRARLEATARYLDTTFSVAFRQLQYLVQQYTYFFRGAMFS